MPKGLFAKIIIKIEAEENDIDNYFEKVENEYVIFADELDALVNNPNYLPLLTLSFTEE